MLEPFATSGSASVAAASSSLSPTNLLTAAASVEEVASDEDGSNNSITIEIPSPSSRKISSVSRNTNKTPSPSRTSAFISSGVTKFMTLDFPNTRRKLSLLLPPKSATPNNQNANISNNHGKRSMSSRLSAGQMSLRRFSGGNKKDNNNSATGGGGGTMSSGRSLLAATIRARFGQHDSSDETTSLITHLDKYSDDELKEYRQVFNMFDADRSGAIGLDELENAISNLGMDPKTVDLESVIKEADKRGNHQIDFDEFCEVMKKMSEKNRSWNEIIKECFAVFDRSESGLITRKDFEYILREMGGIQNVYLIEELFTEFDVDSDGFIDYDEFGFLVKNYLTDDDVF